MSKSGLKYLVIGAGAVGGITAAFLRKNGIDVEIVCKYEDYATLISQKGINISGECGVFNIKIPAYANVSQVKEKKDIIILATKATDVMEVAPSLTQVLDKSGYVFSLLNGICEDEIATILGKDRVIGCVTGWGATMESQGNLIMTSKGDFIIGYPWTRRDEMLNSLAETLSCVVPVIVTDNIVGHKYSKLIINSCITSLGAICGLYLGKMLRIRKARLIFIEIIREAVLVAASIDLSIEIFGGKLDFKKFVEEKGLFSGLRRHLLLLIIGYKYRKLKSSGLQSLERGKQTEVDFLNGYIVKTAKIKGVEVPVNEFIISMIHQIEKKEREISVNNFNDPFFNRFGS
jgi:2-dehydropantoate 2-reductase